MTLKTIKNLRALKKRLKKTLPQKVSEVINSYEDFCSHPIPEDAKGFTAHHNACRSAVDHAETLLKLARWTDEEAEVSGLEADSNINLERLFNEAAEEEARFGED